MLRNTVVVPKWSAKKVVGAQRVKKKVSFHFLFQWGQESPCPAFQSQILFSELKSNFLIFYYLRTRFQAFVGTGSFFTSASGKRLQRQPFRKPRGDFAMQTMWTALNINLQTCLFLIRFKLGNLFGFALGLRSGLRGRVGFHQIRVGFRVA